MTDLYDDWGDEDVYDDDGELLEPCFACGEPGCPGYCDDYQTYNMRPAETGEPGRYRAPLRGSGTCPRCGAEPGGLHREECTEPEPGDLSYVGKPCPGCGVQPGQEHTPVCGARDSGMTHWQGWDDDGCHAGSEGR